LSKNDCNINSNISVYSCAFLIANIDMHVKCIDNKNTSNVWK